MIDITNLNVIIIGCPGSGKSYFANKISDDTHTIIHTDDYIKHGYVESMYKAFDDILKCKGKTIVEGIQGYRLLRHGYRTGKYKPDIVIELKISDEKLEEIYDSNRDYDKLEFVKKMNRSNAKVLSDYILIARKELPIWHTINDD